MGRKFLLCLVLLCCASRGHAGEPAFRVVVLTTGAADHAAMIEAARPALAELGARNGFAVDFADDLSRVSDESLAAYQVVFQLQLAPFEIPQAQQGALQRFVDQGKGWVGVHAAGLTGRQFQDAKAAYWEWFERFFGGVVYSPHPAFQTARVLVADRNHPATRNLPPEFQIADEWYEFDRSPRPGVRVLATIDESSYRPKRPMGDHPIIWSNEKYERMIYIGIGHAPALWSDETYRNLIRDSILWAGSKAPRFKALVLAEHDENHFAMVEAARPFLNELAQDNNFGVDFLDNLDRIDESFLSGYRFLIQLNWTPIGWGPKQQAAFQRFVQQGKGWVGIHHAGLTGDRVLASGQRNWDWYQDSFLGARYADYITPPVKATVRVEDRNHPATRRLPASFAVSDDEWYEFDRSPRRPAVRVLASVDESTYSPKKPMGDHPVVWSNEKYRRMIYILMGHSPGIFHNSAFTTLLRDAILWAAEPPGN